MAKAGNTDYLVETYPRGNLSIIDSETGSPSTGGKETNNPKGFWEMQTDWLLEHVRVAGR